MFDEKRFRAAVALAGLNMGEVARIIGVSISTLYRKISGKSDFYRVEIQKLRYAIGDVGISMEDIFFSDKVTEKKRRENKSE